MSNEKPRNDKSENSQDKGASAGKLHPVRVDNPRDTARTKAQQEYQDQQKKK